MTALEMQNKKVELARFILEADDWNLINAVERAVKRVLKKQGTEIVEVKPYTTEEINSWLDESEADDEAGRTISSEEMSRRMKQFIQSKILSE